MNDYTIINTQDGSFTVYSPLHTEACHSVEGAKSETLRYYIEGCEIEKKATTQNELAILEIGFGIGVGLQCVLETLEKNYLKTAKLPFLTYIALEKDQFILHELFPKLIWFKSDIYPSLLNFKPGFYGEIPCLELHADKLKIIILMGDARVTLPHLDSLKFDAIFQDAFSIQKNPELWSIEWFKLLKKYTYTETILSTYSASSRIRKSLLAAEWSVVNGLKFGNKRMSTRARVTGVSDPEILEKLARSPVTALYDSEILAPFLKSTDSSI